MADLSSLENELKRRQESESLAPLTNRLSRSNDNESSLDKLSKHPLISAILGAGDAPRKLMTNAANLAMKANPLNIATSLMSGQQQAPQIPFEPSSEGTAYDVGNIIGDVGTFIGGGELAEGANLIPQALKQAPKLARILGGTAYGGLADRDTAKGASTGAAIQTALEGMPIAGRALSKVADKFNVGKYADELVGHLTGGKSFKEIKDSLINKIKEAHSNVENTMKEKFGDFFNKWGNYKVNFKDSKYGRFKEDYFPKEFEDLNNTHNDYLKDPTINKAHKLQSDIGKELAPYQKEMDSGKILSPDERAIYNKLKKAEIALTGKFEKDKSGKFVKTELGDIEEFFNRRKIPGEYQKYQDAIDFSRDNYYPFYSNKNLSKIVRGKLTNPGKSIITGIFKNPEKNMQKVADLLGDKGKETIIGLHYSPEFEKGGEKISQALGGESTERAGMDYYKTGRTENIIRELEKRVENKKSLSSILPLLTGGAEMALGGGASGGFLAALLSKNLKEFAEKIPYSKIVSGAENTGKKLNKAAQSKVARALGLHFGTQGNE